MTNIIYNNIEAMLISFIFFVLIFIPMEKVFPAKKDQKIFRPRWILDFCFFTGQYILWTSLILLILNVFGEYLTSIIPVFFQLKIQNQPLLIQAILFLFFSDLLIYCGHRLQHRIDFLWRFHKIHHSTEHLDWLSAYRDHPLDTLYTMMIMNIPAFIMGFSFESIASIIAFRGIWSIYIHSNVKLSMGVFRMWIGAPELHHWHHTLNRKSSNYSNTFPIIDVIFGTYKYSSKEPNKFGIKEKTPNSYLGHLLKPLVSEQIWKKLKINTLKWL